MRLERFLPYQKLQLVELDWFQRLWQLKTVLRYDDFLPYKRLPLYMNQNGSLFIWMLTILYLTVRLRPWEWQSNTSEPSLKWPKRWDDEAPSVTAALCEFHGADILLSNTGQHYSASRWRWQPFIFCGHGFQDLPATPGQQPPGRRAGGIRRRDWDKWDATTHPGYRSWEELLSA